MKKNTSQLGLEFEAVLVPELIKKWGGRAATQNEQITEQWDYMTADGFKIDIKFQPKAYAFGSINAELKEFNPDNPSQFTMSWLYRSQAEAYIWYTGTELLMFSKEELRWIVDAAEGSIKLTKDERYKVMDFRGWNGIKKTNGVFANQMSGQFKGNSRTQAITYRIPLRYMNEHMTTHDMTDFTTEIANICKVYKQ